MTRDQKRQLALKSTYRCIQCRAGLFEEERGVHITCVDCRAAKRIYNKLSRRRRAGARFARRKYRRDPFPMLEAKKASRLDKQLRGECRECPAEVTPDSDFCAAHLERHRASARDYQRRRRAA